MRIRKNPLARPALERSEYFVPSPTAHIGKWHSLFERIQPIRLELGCGRGAFISKLAASKPDINFLAIDIKDDVLYLAKKKIDEEYKRQEKHPVNLKLMSQEIRLISRILNEADQVERIYINFPNPWYKGMHRTRRLTHPEQLLQYRVFLAPKGQIWFKTDDDDLFEDSLRYFKRCGFQILFQTRDLHQADFEENIPTEHEEMFTEQGHQIKFVIAEKISIDEEAGILNEIDAAENPV